jgi:type VI secretion system secreted protein VgrG
MPSASSLLGAASKTGQLPSLPSLPSLPAVSLPKMPLQTPSLMAGEVLS